VNHQCLACQNPPEACESCNGGTWTPKAAQGPQPAPRKLEQLDSWQLPEGSPDGSHALDHLWMTAGWRIDGLPPVVRVRKYVGPELMQAIVDCWHPIQGVFTRKVHLKNLEWCEGGEGL